MHRIYISSSCIVGNNKSTGVYRAGDRYCKYTSYNKDNYQYIAQMFYLSSELISVHLNNMSLSYHNLLPEN